MRLILLGSGAFGLPTFAHLHAHHDVRAVVSQPDRPAGRQRQLTATPVAQWADKVGLPVLKPPDANALDTIAQLTECKADAAVVIAFGQKLSPLLVDTVGKLAVNLHASLLPKYRGAAPINWAIIHGEPTTGVSVIGLAQKMDAGLVYATVETPIDPLETAGELHDRLAALGPDAVSDVLRAFADGSLRGVAQDEHQATHAPKLSKADGRVDFTQDAQSVRSRIHGLTPWPGVRVRWIRQTAPEKPLDLALLRVSAEPDLSCFIGYKGSGDAPQPGEVIDGPRVVVGDGTVRLLEVQVPGKRPMPIDEFMRGHPIATGDRFES